MMKLLIVVFGIFLNLSMLLAQQGVTKVNPETAYVGSPISLTHEFEISKIQKDSALSEASSLAILRSSLKSQIPDSVRYKEFQSGEWKVEKIQGRWYLVYTQQIMILDTGYLVITPRKFVFGDEVLMSSPSLMRVDFVPQKTQVPYEDIHEDFAALPDIPFDLQLWLGSNWYWCLLVLGLLFIIWRLTRKRDQEITVRSPKEEALYLLDELQQMEVENEDHLKVYFAKQTFILKQYLEQSRAWRALDKTSTELLGLLRASGEDDSSLKEWSTLLNTSDLIKFAKGQGSVDLVKDLHRRAKTIIQNDQDA